MIGKDELPDRLLTTWKMQRIANNQHVESTVFPPGLIFAPTKDSADHFLNAKFCALTFFNMSPRMATLTLSTLVRGPGVTLTV